MEWLLSSISGPGELAGIRAIEFHPTKDNFQGAIVVATTARRARRLIRRAQHRIQHHLLRQTASATSIRKYSTDTAAIATSNAQSAASPAAPSSSSSLSPRQIVLTVLRVFTAIAAPLPSPKIPIIRRERPSVSGRVLGCGRGGRWMGDALGGGRLHGGLEEGRVGR
mmetsp:Transcript_8273/g.21741  ORF Transcript_8273/g.21741 Transcript_8273/m.21741 type:complete len:167 (+) Transcript_8273:43-543(+)